MTGQRGLVRTRHILIGAVALGMAMLLLAAVPGIWVAAPAAFLVGMARILYTTSTTAIVQVEARPEMHGRILVLQTVLVAGTTPTGGPFLGWLGDLAGGRATIITGGVVCLLAAALGYFATQQYGN